MTSRTNSTQPLVMFNSFPIANCQTFPRTLGGNPSHHNCLVRVVRHLQRKNFKFKTLFTTEATNATEF